MSDAELLERFLTRGEEAAERAFAELVGRHGAAVRRVCRDVLGDSHEAEDAAQAAFLVLARKARSIREPRSLGAWLHGVALRVARRARAEARRRREAERRGAEALAERADRGPGEGRERCPELHEEVDRLPEKYRMPILLCDLEGRTQEQAARALGWPYGTVQTRLHRGRRKLRDRLARRGVGPLGAVGLGVVAPLAESSASALPPGWSAATARASIRFATHRATGGLVAAPASRLARSVLATMNLGSLGRPAVILAAIGLAAAGLLLTARGSSASRPGTSADGRAGAGLLVASAIPDGTVRDDGGRRDRGAHPGAEKPEGVGPAPGRGIPATPGPVGRDVETSADRPAPRAPASPASRYVGFSGSLLTSRAPAEGPRGLPGDAGRPDGREMFERVWAPNDPRSRGGDGLGPVFNARSCVDCHDLGGSGGAGSAARNVEIATADGADAAGSGFGFSYAFRMDFGAGQFSYEMAAGPAPEARLTPPDRTQVAAIHPGFLASRSVMLHRFGVDRSYQGWRETVPGRHGSVAVRTSQRNPTPLFGVGRIDAIPDEAIVAAAARRFPGSAQSKGRVARTRGGRVGRFGWKAQAATLEEFVRFAAASEMGLEVAGHPQADDPQRPGLGAPGPDMNPEECAALVAHVRGLPAPVVRGPGDARESAALRAGAKTFETIGCAGCHLPSLGGVDGIYSDLLLHDMSPRLGDTGHYAVFVARPGAGDVAAPGPRGRDVGAGPQEWRTPPLWGLRDSAPYLHDGRAATVARAIALHGGQGAPSAERFAQLPQRRKQQLEAFLLSLVAPSGGDQRGDGGRPE